MAGGGLVVTLPIAVQNAYGVQLRVIALCADPIQARADATGTATLLTKNSVDPDQMWRIERLTVTSTSGNQLSLTVTDGSFTRDAGVRPKPNPKEFPAVAEYVNPVTLLGSQQFTLIATGAEPGDVVTAIVQYQIVARVPGGPV